MWFTLFCRVFALFTFLAVRTLIWWGNSLHRFRCEDFDTKEHSDTSLVQKRNYNTLVNQKKATTQNDEIETERKVTMCKVWSSTLGTHTGVPTLSTVKLCGSCHEAFSCHFGYLPPKEQPRLLSNSEVPLS